MMTNTNKTGEGKKRDYIGESHQLGLSEGVLRIHNALMTKMLKDDKLQLSYKEIRDITDKVRANL